MQWSSVRARLTLWSMGVQALILTAIGAAVWLTTRSNLLASVDRELAGRGVPFVRHLEQMSPPKDLFLALGPGAARNPVPFFADADNKQGAMDPIFRYRPRFLDIQGKAMLPISKDTPWDAKGFATALVGEQNYVTIRQNDEPLRVFSIPLRREGNIVGVVQTAFPLTETYRNLDALQRSLLTFTPIALLITGLSGAFQIQRLLRPIRGIAQSAAGIGAADLSERLPVQGNDEFSHLAQTFNGMLGRLEHAFLQQRRFVADASHELRTPLTAIKAHTSLALSGEKSPVEYRQALEGADRAATLMNHIVQDLLLLARLDTGRLSLDLHPLPIGEILDAACALFIGQETPPIGEQIADPNAIVLGDGTHLTRLFTNLLDNAIRHTPPEGTITLRTEAQEDFLLVTVADTGSGIAPEHLPHVCERFYRVDAARTRKQGGTGLGLAICRSIAESHGGTLEIESAPGLGTSVRVRLLLPGTFSTRQEKASVLQTQQMGSP